MDESIQRRHHGTNAASRLVGALFLRPIYQERRGGLEERANGRKPRTALTNMIEAGLSEKEAMEISGHRTRAVFDRYHIISDRRMKQNAEKLGEHLRAKNNASKEESAGKDNGERQNERLT